MPDLIPELAPSQETLVQRVADAVALGDRVCLRGESGSGTSTILHAAAGRVAATSGRSVALLDAQSHDRLAWGVVRHTNGRCVKPVDLTSEGVVLFLDDGDCHVRIRENDPLVIVGQYSADLVIDVPPWTIEDLEIATPTLVHEFGNANESLRNPRRLRLAEACQRLGLSTERPLSECRLDALIVRLLEVVESDSPLSIDFLFAASELGTLPVSTDWFAGWRDLTPEDTEQAALRLHDMGLVDPHSPGEWSTPAIVRAVVRNQMSLPFRQAAAHGLARRLLAISSDDTLNVLPHLTTLWKRLRETQPELSSEIWQRIAPQWTAYGFRFQESSGATHSPAADVARMLIEARRLRQQGAVLEAEHKLAKAVRVAEATLPPDDATRFDVRVEYAEVSLSGSRRSAAVAELRELLATDRARLDRRQRHRIENDLASALFFDGRLLEAASAFQTLAKDVSNGTVAARAWNNAGECYRSLGDFAQAEDALRHATDLFQEAEFGNDPAAVSARMNLAGVLADTGRDAEAIPLFKSVVEARERRLGGDALGTQQAKVGLAFSLCQEQRFEDAAALVTNRPVATGESSIDSAYDVVTALIDRHQNRPVKSELRLLRVAGHEELLPSLRAHTARELAEGYRLERRPDEASRWARVSVEAIKPIAGITPANAFRAYRTATLVELLAKRWETADEYAAVGQTAASRCEGPIFEETSVLAHARALAADPQEVSWYAIATTFEDAWDAFSSDHACCYPVSRLAEHAITLDETQAAASLIDRLVGEQPEPPREWLVVRASLAVLDEDPQAEALWTRIVNEYPSRDAGEQSNAENVLKQLQATTEPTNESPEEQFAARQELVAAFLATDEEELVVEVEDEAGEKQAADLTDSVHDEPSPGHVLDELF